MFVMLPTEARPLRAAHVSVDSMLSVRHPRHSVHLLHLLLKLFYCFFGVKMKTLTLNKTKLIFKLACGSVCCPVSHCFLFLLNFNDEGEDNPCLYLHDMT